MAKICVTIPTYNEAENIEKLLRQIAALGIPELTTVVIDDNSPDGTGRIVEELARILPRLEVIHRFHDRGRGKAGIEGFKYALRHGADLIIEMDADFSHDPKYLPELIESAAIGDIVIGSRYVPGGRDVDRGPLRRLTTFLAQSYIRLLLGLPVRDPTSGYRCFRRRVLEAIDLDRLVSTGPSILQEVLYQAVRKGFTVSEIPIVFEDRRAGETKLNLKQLCRSLYLVWRFRRIYR